MVLELSSSLVLSIRIEAGEMCNNVSFLSVASIKQSVFRRLPAHLIVDRLEALDGQIHRLSKLNVSVYWQNVTCCSNKFAMPIAPRQRRTADNAISLCRTILTCPVAFGRSICLPVAGWLAGRYNWNGHPALTFVYGAVVLSVISGLSF